MSEYLIVSETAAAATWRRRLPVGDFLAVILTSQPSRSSGDVMRRLLTSLHNIRL